MPVLLIMLFFLCSIFAFIFMKIVESNANRAKTLEQWYPNTGGIFALYVVLLILLLGAAFILFMFYVIYTGGAF